jgi:hypothetical protein
LTHIITIRVIPGQSVDPETYIVVRIWADGTVDADYTVPEGDSLFSQIRLLSSEHPKAEDLAPKLRTRTVHLKNSLRLRNAVAKFRKVRIATYLPAALYLDATRYDVSDVTFMNHLTVSVHDSTTDEKNDLLEWAKAVVTMCKGEARRTSK